MRIYNGRIILRIPTSHYQYKGNAKSSGMRNYQMVPFPTTGFCQAQFSKSVRFQDVNPGLIKDDIGFELFHQPWNVLS